MVGVFREGVDEGVEVEHLGAVVDEGAVLEAQVLALADDPALVVDGQAAAGRDGERR